MNKEFLLIDGYNIIYSWDELKAISNNSLEDARQRFIDIMSNYQGFKSNIIVIIVFDGHLQKGNIGNEYKYNNINVIFTKEAQTADEYIEKAVNFIPRKMSVTVATSDYMQQIIIIGRGAIRLSATDLYKEVKSAEKEIRSGYVEKRPPKSNMLLDNLDETMQEWVEEMRRK